MVSPEHELIAENAHRLAERLADHRLAAARRPAAGPCSAGIGLPHLRSNRAAPGEHQAPGRGVDQQRARTGRDGAPSRLSRWCPRSAGRRWRRRECAAAPRRGRAAAPPPRSTAHIRAGRNRPRRSPSGRPAPPRPGRSASARCAALLLAEPRLLDQGLDQRAFFGEQGLAYARAARQSRALPDMAFGLAHGASLPLRRLVAAIGPGPI